MFSPAPLPKDVDRGGADFLHAEIRTRLLERFDLITLEPSVVVDLGAGPGLALEPLSTRFPAARVVALDHAAHVLREIPQSQTALPLCADAHRLPLPDGAIDVIFSNLMVHACADIPAVLAEMRRVIRSPGLLSLSCFGPATLSELRAAWAAADGYAHVSDFPTMHALGDGLIGAGFAEPVLDCERLTVTYADTATLVADLRAIGEFNRSGARNRGLTSRARWARMRTAYEERRDSRQRLPATVEIIYAQAWAGPPRLRAGRNPGEFEIPVDTLRRPVA